MNHPTNEPLRLSGEDPKVSEIGPCGEGLPESVLSTPAMKQYIAIKKEYESAFLFYRMGDFYELFFKDAVIGSKLLDLALTSRSSKNHDAKIPMAGVPVHSAGQYITKLTQLGRQVAICEQTQDASEAKGIVERKVIRVVSPGLSYDLDSVPEDENIYLAALTGMVRSNSLSMELALAWVDLTTGEFKTRRFDSVESIQGELHRLNPKELLISTSFKSSEIYSLLELESAHSFSITEIGDYYFKSNFANQALLDHFSIQTLEPFELEPDESATHASGALMRYLQDTQKDHGLMHIETIELVAEDASMALDSSTIDALELISPKDQPNLFRCLDHTLTPMGKRRLKEWITRPLVDLDRIKNRADVVELLVEDRETQTSLTEALDPVGDLERIFSKISLGTAQPKDLIRLKNSIEKFGVIENWLLALGENELHVEGISPGDKFQSHGEIFDALLERLNDMPPATTRDGRLVKKGYHPERDQFEDLVINGKAKLVELEAKERERTKIPTLKIKYNRVFGYFIEVTKSQISKVPEDYNRRQTTSNAERYITSELKEFEAKTQRAQEELVKLEQQIWDELIEWLRREIPGMKASASIVASVDVLLSLAKIAGKNKWIRPELNRETKTQITEGRHPVVEASMPSGQYVPNSIWFDEGGKFFHLITGPNMAGKSTIMRQVAVLVLMAQMGSFIPAKDAKISVVDRIFTRIGAQDRISKGQSTFMVEMVETARILRQATSKSLILLDEVGRGTSTYDGLSIAWALAEFIHDELKARTLFATHYHELCVLEEQKKGVENLNVAVDDSGDEIVFLHQIQKGPAPGSYGIHVAKLAGIPNGILRRASEILQKSESGEMEVIQASSYTKINPQLNLFGEEPPSRVRPRRSKKQENISQLVQSFVKLDLLSEKPFVLLDKVASFQSQLKNNLDSDLDA